jgi:hypothetical protein
MVSPATGITDGMYASVFFESREDVIANFPAILELDIRLHKDYNALPFSYDDGWCEKEDAKAQTEHL